MWVRETDHGDLGAAIVSLQKGERDALTVRTVAQHMGNNARDIVRSVGATPSALGALLEADCGEAAVSALCALLEDEEEATRTRTALARGLRNVVDAKVSTALAAAQAQRKKRVVREVAFSDVDAVSELPPDPAMAKLRPTLDALERILARGSGTKADFIMADTFLTLGRAALLLGDPVETVLRRGLGALRTWYEAIEGSHLLQTALSQMLFSPMAPALFALACRENAELDKKAKVRFRAVVGELESQSRTPQQSGVLLSSLCLMLGRWSRSKRRKLMRDAVGFRGLLLRHVESNPSCGLALLEELSPEAVRPLVRRLLLEDLLEALPLVAEFWKSQSLSLLISIACDGKNRLLASTRAAAASLCLQRAPLEEEVVFEALRNASSSHREWLFDALDWNRLEVDEEFWKQLLPLTPLPASVAVHVVEALLKRPSDATQVRIASSMSALLSGQAEAVVLRLEREMEEQPTLTAALLDDSSDNAAEVQSLLFARMAPLLVLRVMSADSVAAAASESVALLLLTRMTQIYEFAQVRRLAAEAFSKVEPTLGVRLTLPLVESASLPEATILKPVLFSWCSFVFLHGNVFGSRLSWLLRQLLSSPAALDEPVTEFCVILMRCEAATVLQCLQDGERAAARRIGAALLQYVGKHKEMPSKALSTLFQLRAQQPLVLTLLFQVIAAEPSSVASECSSILDYALDAFSNRQASTEIQIRAMTLMSAVLTVQDANVTPIQVNRVLEIIARAAEEASGSPLQKLAVRLLQSLK